MSTITEPARQDYNLAHCLEPISSTNFRQQNAPLIWLTQDRLEANLITL